MSSGVQIQDRVDVQVALETSVSVPASLKKAALFIDGVPIMPDVRFLDVTRSDYASVLKGSGFDVARAFAASYFSQKRVPQSLQIVRWAEGGAPSYWVAGPGTVWTFGNDGWWGNPGVASMPIGFQEGAEGPTQSVTGDYSTVKTKEDVASAMQAAFSALSSPDIEHLEKTKVYFDSAGRFVLEFDSQIADDIRVTASQGASSLDWENALSFSAVEGESIESAITALRDLDNSAYFYCMRSGKMNSVKHDDYNAVVEEFARAVEPLEKLGVVLISDPAVKAAGDTDVLSSLQTLGFTRTMAIYFENAVERFAQAPDAAALAAVFPGNEGAITFSQVDLAGVAPSGFSSPLSAGQTKIITDKGGNVIERVGGFTYLFSGLTLSGEELRIMYGRDWFVTQIRAEVFSYLMSADLAAFDAETIGVIISIIRRYGELAIARRILVDTEERPFVVNVPDPDDFTILQRRSRKLELPEAFRGYLNSAVNEVQIVGVWAA